MTYVTIGNEWYTKKEIKDHFNQIKHNTIDNFFYVGDEQDMLFLQHVIKEHILYNFNQKNR